MDQFGLSLVQITSIWTMCYFIYGVMGLPAGFLADKWSYKAVLTIFLIGAPLALIIMAAAQSVSGLIVGMALLGLFASLYHPSALAMISHSIRERGKALGLQGVAGNLGLAFSPIIVGILARTSWRYACYILSIPSFITVLVFFFVSRKIKIEQIPANTSGKSTVNSPKPQKLTFWAIALLYVAMAVAGFTYQGMTTMLPTYLDSKLLFSSDPDPQNNLDSEIIPESLKSSFQSYGIAIPEDAKVSIKKAGRRWQVIFNHKTYIIWKEANNLSVYANTGKGKIFTAMIFLVGVLGQYIGGHSSDRWRKMRLYLLFNAITMPFMILVGLLTGFPLILAAALFALFHFAGQPVENSMIAQYTPSRLRSSSYGMKFVFTFGIGSFASAFSGYIGESFGLSSVFIALGGVIFLLILIMTLLNFIAKEAKSNGGIPHE